jgi:serine/threonine-protein kinase
MAFRRLFRRGPAPGPAYAQAGPPREPYPAAPPAYPPDTLVDEAVAGPPLVEEEEVGPPPPPVEPPPDRTLWPWLLLLLAVVLGGLAAWYFLSRNDNNHPKRTTTVVVTPAPGRIAVPSVVGLAQTKAVNRITGAKLRARLRTGTSNLSRGVVFREQPAAGTTLARGAPVTLFVSSGPPKTGVPNVVGIKAQPAVAQLRAAGFTSKLTTVAAKQPAGIVVAQTPAAGARAAKGATVTLKVSKGPPLVSVPSVVGQKQAAAQSTLTAAGLKPFVFHVASPEPKGTVTAQKPVGGARAPKGSKVRINVATGPPPTTTATTPSTTGASSAAAPPSKATVPNVVGINQTVALRRLQSAGLSATVVYVASSSPAGRVTAQSPSGGTVVKRGTRVQIKVSNGPNPKPSATIPDVVGEDQQTASSDLKAAGFKVNIIGMPTTDQSQNGIVLDQQPESGTKAPAGSYVTIYVGQFSG